MKGYALIAFIVASLALAYWLSWRQYAECRAHDFSRLYCALTVTR